jgi:hypothetical protein
MKLMKWVIETVIGKVVYGLFILFVLNMAVTRTIDAFMHPELTTTQLALRVFKSFLWDFSL